MDFFSPLELSVLVTVLAGAALARAYAPLTVEQVDGWTRAHGVELTAESWPVVGCYLRRAQIFRTWGAIAGLVVPSVVRPVLGWPWQVAGVGADGASAAELGFVFLGYLAGAVCAELTVSRPLGGRTRSAALLRRELTDYLPRGLLWLQRGLATAALVGVVAMRFVPRDASSFTPSTGSVAGFAIVIVVVAVALERLELWLVRRPQPFLSEPLLAADDAIRSQSLHSLAGAGIAFLFFVCSGAAFQLALADEELMRQMVWAPGLIALLLALAACQYYGARAWRVQRARRAPPPTTPA